MHELEVLLSRLKMEHLSYHVESLLEQAAKKELNYLEFLCMALQQEWNGRHQRGMESRLKQARLPWVKTLEQFDFTFQPGIDRKVVRELAGLAFVERSENVILLGPPGVGKTHLAIAPGVKAVDAGHRVLFMPLDRLIATLMKAKQENRLERQLQQLSYARVLILYQYAARSNRPVSRTLRCTAGSSDEGTDMPSNGGGRKSVSFAL